MATVARLLPRHWDGSRLLRFLAGLALIALSFAALPAAPVTAIAASPPVGTSVSSIDPVGTGSAAAGSAAVAHAPAAAAQAGEVDRSTVDRSTDAGSAADPAQPVDAPFSAPWIVAPRVDAISARAAAAVVGYAAARLPAGTAPARQGSRAPPLR